MYRHYVQLRDSIKQCRNDNDVFSTVSLHYMAKGMKATTSRVDSQDTESSAVSITTYVNIIQIQYIVNIFCQVNHYH
jgi:hypothetical protein